VPAEGLDPTEAVLKLGGVVVKTACGIWLGAFGGIVGEISDMLSGRVRSRLDQRRVERLFDQCADIVAAKTLDVLKHEFAALPDHELNAAVLAVHDTFATARLADEFLIQADLDARLVERGLGPARAAVLARAALGGVAEALYHRVLRESCAYLVEVVTTLPRFQPGVLTELLRRDTAILETLEGFLTRLPELRGADDFAADYRRQVVNKFDRIQMFGVTLGEGTRRYPLSVAYISLTALHHGRRPDRAGPGRLSTGLRVEEALREESRVLLMGEAGSGKTTLLHWLAVRSARGDFTGPLSGWNQAVPFYIPLRRYAERELPAPQDFLDAAGRHIAAEMPDGWVQRLLREGRGLVLVDGVDELREGVSRESAGEWLRELVRTFPNSRYVVTSRPAAVTDGWLARDGFAAAELQSMSVLDVRVFVRRWHRAVSHEIADADERDRLDGDERALLAAIEADRHLRALAVNPLLCALLCALNRERNRDLPRDRMEVYAAALEMLLGRRDRERDISAPVGLTLTAQMIVLQDLALWLLRNGWSDASVDRAWEQIERSARNLPRVDLRAETILRHLLERSGLLREPIAGRVDFIHRTFQEYLAGKAAIDGDDVGFLVANALDDQWRQVVIMAAGHAQPRQREEILTGLLHPSAHDVVFERNRDRLALIAVACLQNATQISPELHEEIEQVTKTLVPPRSMESAESLAAAGEVVLDVLAERPPRDVPEARSSIRAAALVGGSGAIPVIGEIASRYAGDAMVDDELIRAWRMFDPEEYAAAVLSKLTMTTLSLADPALLAGIVHLGALRDVRLSVGQELADLAPLARLPRLDTLRLSWDMSLPALSPLTGAPKLTTLFLDGEPTSADLCHLAGFSALRRVEFVSAPYRNALTCLPELPERPGGLTDVRIENWELLESLHGIERWAGVTSLHIASCPELSDLSALTKLASLRELHLEQIRENSLVSLGRLKDLRALRLPGWREVDLTPLARRRDLRVSVPREAVLYGVDLLGKGSTLELI
jgi:hypothetical protein